LTLNRRIYVDLDDVLSETARAFVALLEKHFDKTVPFDSMTSFDLARSFDLDAKELEQFWHLAHAPEALLELQPIEGARDALYQFTSMGYEIDVITGRPPFTAPATMEWLEKNHFPHHRLTFVDKYGRGGLHPSYSTVITLDELARLSFCYAIEDSGDMVAFIATKMALPVALLERPWNREYRFLDAQSLTRIDRCVDWAGVVARFGQRRPDL
jgi:uncharacterized HAD superfamily protein